MKSKNGSVSIHHSWRGYAVQASLPPLLSAGALPRRDKTRVSASYQHQTRRYSAFACYTWRAYAVSP